MGNSNGAALANQLAIESRLPNIRNYVTAVSPLNELQHDGRHFKAKGDDNIYQAVATPRTGARLMNISGTEDHLIPYQGGPSPIPAKNGKLGFVAAEESVFLWAKAMGYQGGKLMKPSRTVGKLEVFSYLEGSIIHYKVLGEGHGAAGAIDEATLMQFLDRKQ
jgi:poly(3-hydroxybutyrate) depolymerase